MQSESRQYVFARDEWGYYCVLFPSDVQSLDPTVNSFMENVRQNELDGILDDFISRNALEEYGEKSLGACEEIESNEEEKPNTARNAKLMTASFGAGYTADSMDYPALVCNDVEAPAMAMEAKTNTDLM